MPTSPQTFDRRQAAFVLDASLIPCYLAMTNGISAQAFPKRHLSNLDYAGYIHLFTLGPHQPFPRGLCSVRYPKVHRSVCLLGFHDPCERTKRISKNSNQIPGKSPTKESERHVSSSKPEPLICCRCNQCFPCWVLSAWRKKKEYVGGK